MVIRVKGTRMFISESSLKEAVTRVVSKTTIGYPTATAEVRNKRGKIGVYHSGCSFVGATSISDPKLDWCIQDKTTPRIINTHIILPMMASPTFKVISTRPLNVDKNPGRFTLPLNCSAIMCL